MSVRRLIPMYLLILCVAAPGCGTSAKPKADEEVAEKKADEEEAAEKKADEEEEAAEKKADEGIGQGGDPRDPERREPARRGGKAIRKFFKPRGKAIREFFKPRGKA